MKIVIDIGNTSITAGLFERKKIIKKIHFKLKNDFDDFLDSLDSYEVKTSIISSVVPQKTNEYIKIIKEISIMEPSEQLILIALALLIVIFAGTLALRLGISLKQ